MSRDKSSKQMSQAVNGSTSNDVTLSFHNIRYEVEKKKFLWKKPEKLEILCGVSGVLPPGLNAVMGPTGSGKTSLLDILAQRKNPKGLKNGYVLLNGEKTTRDFRLMSGYVVQDDVVMGTLSVRENIAFSANLRLSNKTYDKEARKTKVDHVIEQLGLQECADTKVGNEFIRGVSGGERKRVNIGMEMVLDPPVLFLDEPTTGLDANTANSIILLLYKLASGGRNIIMSIHQPRYSIYSLFDRLIILNKGQMIYRGMARAAVEYFRSIGYPCPTYHNPADFFLDVIGGDVNTVQLLKRMRSTGDEKHLSLPNDNQASTSQMENTLKNLEESFIKSVQGQEEERNLLALQQAYEAREICGEKVIKSSFQPAYNNGFFSQFRTLSKRTILNALRNPMVFYGQVILFSILGAIVGLLFYQSDTSYQTGIQNRAGCFFFLVTIQIMSNLSALQVFIKNRANFIHEVSSGYYRTSVYFITQVFMDLIPNRIIPNLFFCSVTYFMIGFQMEAGKFFFYMFVLDFCAITACTMSFCVSATVRVYAVANAVVSLPITLMMLFGGFLANTTDMLDWLEWLKYISLFRYGINAVTVNEMSGLVFIDNATNPGFDAHSNNPCINTITHQFIENCTTGEMYMEVQGIPYGVWGMWQNIAALGGMFFTLLLLAYIQLRRIDLFK